MSRRTVPEDRRLIGYRELAELIGVERRTLERWRAAGRIKGVKICGVVRFRPEEVRKLIESGAK